MTRSTFRSPGFKMLVLGVLALLLLIPLETVNGLIKERAARARDAEAAIAQQWGGAQVLAPAYLVATRTVVQPEGDHLVRRQTTEVLLPESIGIEATLAPEVRHRGIFELPVYTSVLRVEAAFAPEALAALRAAADPGSAIELRLALSDTRGIRGLGEVLLDGRLVQFASAPRRLAELPALGVDLPQVPANAEQGLRLSYRLDLAGTGALQFLPLGRTTRVHLSAPWPHPDFSGAFLPASRSLDARGFDARWQVLAFNRDYPERFPLQEVATSEITASAFGLSLFQPAGTYQQNERSGKYGLLMIALVFAALFLFESLLGLSLHPIQYGLVGLALALFYLLLLAFSEHLGFARAYLIAAVAGCVLLGGYARAVLASTRRALALSGLQAAAYGTFFLLVRSEDYALVLGSGALFAVLAAIMYLTRRTDWHRLGASAPVPGDAPVPTPG